MNADFEKYWRERRVDPFSPIQKKVFSDPVFLDFSKNLFIVAPTSSGKSLIIEYFISFFLSRGKKVIYLSPFKSIIEEKSKEFSPMSQFFEKDMYISTHEVFQDDKDIVKGRYGLLLTIYEKMGYFLQKSPTFLEDLGLLVLDETSIIEDKTRGPYIDILIAYVRKRAKILAVTSFASSPQRFAEYLDANLLTSDERPTPIRIGYLKKGIFHWKKKGEDYDREILLDEDIPLEEELFFLLEKFWREDGAIVFFPTRKAAKEAFSYIGERLPVIHDSVDMNELPKTVFSVNAKEYILRGIGYHSRDLTYPERQFIERLVQDKKIKLLFATTTLALGVNLPFRNVVFPQRLSLSPGIFSNMIGRAARGKRYPYGRAIFLKKEDINFREFPSSMVNFKDKFLVYTFLLRKEVFGINEEELYLQYEIENMKRDALLFLKSEGLIEKDRLIPTALGRLVATSGIDLKSFLDIKKIIGVSSELSMEKLIYLFVKVYVLKKFYIDPIPSRDLFFLLSEAQKVLGLTFLDSSYYNINFDHIRKTFIVLELLAGRPLIDVEKRYGISAGILLEFFDRFLWVVDVSARIIDYLPIGENNIRELLNDVKFLGYRERELEGYKLYIDYDRPYEVYFSGRVIKLTYKQFELLALLSEVPGKTVSYDEIMSRLWKDNYDIYPHKQISYHKGEICKKLGEKVIKSVKKRGLYLDLSPDEVYYVKG